MHVVIDLPQECAAAILARVVRHRGRVLSSEYRDGIQLIRARIPQAEVGAFATVLWRETGGRARSSMVLYEHWPVSQPPPGDPAAGVREPRPKVPVGRTGAVSVPEPDPDPDRDH
jgi:translation elongation factor EF-G